MPKDLRDYVDRRTVEGGFGAPTEYVRHLIRRDKESEAERELERLVMEGIQSGRSRTNVKAVFARLHKRIDEISHRLPAYSASDRATSRERARISCCANKVAVLCISRSMRSGVTTDSMMAGQSTGIRGATS